MKCVTAFGARSIAQITDGSRVMKIKRTAKYCVDLLMVILLLLLMGYSLIGETAHEWMGLTMTICFMTHQFLNIKWYQALNKGGYTPARIARTALNFLLLLIMLTQAVSGILLSRHVIPISGISGMSVVRTLHLLGSHWGFVLMSIHLGFHWSSMTGTIQNKQKSFNPALIWVMRTLTLVVAVWGIYVFSVRQMAEYLFLRSQFVFFDFSTPRIIYVAETCAMVGLFCCIGYYLLKALHTIPIRTKRSNRI